MESKSNNTALRVRPQGSRADPAGQRSPPEPPGRPHPLLPLSSPQRHQGDGRNPRAALGVRRGATPELAGRRRRRGPPERAALPAVGGHRRGPGPAAEKHRARAAADHEGARAGLRRPAPAARARPRVPHDLLRQAAHRAPAAPAATTCWKCRKSGTRSPSTTTFTTSTPRAASRPPTCSWTPGSRASAGCASSTTTSSSRASPPSCSPPRASSTSTCASASSSRPASGTPSCSSSGCRAGSRTPSPSCASWRSPRSCS